MRYLLAFLLCFCLLPANASADVDEILGQTIAGGAVDGSVGQIVHTESYNITASRIWHTSFTATVQGTVRYGHVYVGSSNSYTSYLGLYSSDGTKLLCCEIIDDSAGWKNCDGGSTVELGAGTYYIGLSQSSGQVTVGQDADGGGGRYYDVATPGCSTALNPEETLSAANAGFAMVWDNESGSPE